MLTGNMDGLPDKTWMTYHRADPRYITGIFEFMNFARRHSNGADYYFCPCKRCKNGPFKVTMDVMYHHLSHSGLSPDYTVWHLHGEVSGEPAMLSQRRQWLQDRVGPSSGAGPSVNPQLEILHDAYPYYPGYHADAPQQLVEDNSGMNFNDMVDDDYEKYDRLLKESQTPLYEGSEETVLSAILDAMEMKNENGWSDTSVDSLCIYINKLLPKGHTFPCSYSRIKKILSDLSLGYERIDACEFNCVLFRGALVNERICPVCYSERYKPNTNDIPKKIIRNFPLTPRLKRLFMSPHTAKHMRWLGERICVAGSLSHPADGEAFQHFDRTFPGFARDCRNVRLGVATDGFNPFGTMGTLHSTWPVVVMPYNLPPSMCMKKEYNMLSVLIPGPKSPGKCLSVLIEPMIEELIHLWVVGVHTFDRVDNEVFLMKAAVMWTISDFPGLGMLAGSTVKGYKACPICLDELTSEHICGRIVYEGHRKWLHQDHPWRLSKAFNGKEEFGGRPYRKSGDEILEDVRSNVYPILSQHEDLKVPYNPNNRQCWTHESIFWKLPYWSSLKIRHCLDVMHIEKNVCDNILGTIFSIESKSKDGPKARAALKKRNVRKNQWQRAGDLATGKVPHAPFLVKKDDLEDVFQWFRDVKYPLGYAGSLRSKVKVSSPSQFYGLKTHDCHVLLQRLLPVVIRGFLPENVVKPLIALSNWFRQLCSRELKKEVVRDMETEIVMILCNLELIFPPHFFTSMVHLMVHLPEQVFLTGPVHYTWMYPIER